MALCLSAWVTAGSVALAVADGLGEHALRRALIGVALVAAYAAAIAGRRAVCEGLRLRPWLVVPVAAVLIGVIGFDQPVNGAYVAVSLTPIGLAIVVARARTLWLCVAVLTGGYALAVLVRYSPAELARAGDLGGVFGALLSYPVVALVLVAVRGLFTYLADHALRVPSVQEAIAPAEVALLVSGAPAARLTRTEIRVVEKLASGYAPKQVAVEMDVAVGTIRTHIKRAKRKTGAKTLRELAGLTTDPLWPRVERAIR
jgi:DNA-binding CsgD family transcriptional regulator